MLDGRRLLITGVLNRDSIAYATAERAQQLGAEILLTGFGRGMRMTQRAARSLPTPAEVLELDVNEEGQLLALRAELTRRWGTLDGVLHAIAHAPPDALGGSFIATSAASAEAAFRTSAFSLKSLAGAVQPLFGQEGGAIVALGFDAQLAWPAYDWMGVAKAALESVARYLARDLGALGVRVNLVSAGPIETLAAGGIPGFDELAARWGAVAPLGWDSADAAPIADAACFLLSAAARGITGEMLHVDGGYHAIGARA